jgi:hypothetical protein
MRRRRRRKSNLRIMEEKQNEREKLREAQWKPLRNKERQYILIYGKHWYTDRLSENNTHLSHDLKIKIKKINFMIIKNLYN